MENINDFYNGLDSYKNDLHENIGKLTDEIKVLLEDENVVKYLNKVYQLQVLNNALKSVTTSYLDETKKICVHPMLFVENDIDGRMCTCVLCQKHFDFEETKMVELYDKKRLIGKKCYGNKVVIPLINDYKFIEYIKEKYLDIYKTHKDEDVVIEDLLWDYYCNSNNKQRSRNS